MRLSFGSLFRHLVFSGSALLLALALSAPAAAIPVTVFHSDLPTCDPLFVPPEVDELGTGLFPPDETIVAGDIPTGIIPCPSNYAGLGNILVTMTNLTPFDFKDVWYVADRGFTTISNTDGTINDGLAFRIDAVGINTPLVFESLTPDGIFESGETWDFVIQEYFNLGGLPASAFDSPGAVGVFSGGGPSSGSIVAIPIPEPTTALLLACGLLGLAAHRRRVS